MFQVKVPGSLGVIPPEHQQHLDDANGPVAGLKALGQCADETFSSSVSSPAVHFHLHGDWKKFCDTKLKQISGDIESQQFTVHSFRDYFFDNGLLLLGNASMWLRMRVFRDNKIEWSFKWNVKEDRDKVMYEEVTGLEKVVAKVGQLYKGVKDHDTLRFAFPFQIASYSCIRIELQPSESSSRVYFDIAKLSPECYYSLITYSFGSSPNSQDEFQLIDSKVLSKVLASVYLLNKSYYDTLFPRAELLPETSTECPSCLQKGFEALKDIGRVVLDMDDQDC